MEDEAGAINVIVHPDIYERDRTAIRLEPFLTVVGRLQKDGATMNVIAQRVEAPMSLGAPRSCTRHCLRPWSTGAQTHLVLHPFAISPLCTAMLPRPRAGAELRR